MTAAVVAPRVLSGAFGIALAARTMRQCCQAGRRSEVLPVLYSFVVFFAAFAVVARTMNRWLNDDENPVKLAWHMLVVERKLPAFLSVPLKTHSALRWKTNVHVVEIATAELKRYRDTFYKGCVVYVYSNGYGAKVRDTLDRLPSWVRVRRRSDSVRLLSERRRRERRSGVRLRCRHQAR